ncbi:hypothetical protein F4805DRAFT_422342 [Annulohypoxylon moriforme]|nr:hypothetical protein F4805DRAFT_422342 [Annulohypoxylon moriforme]
MTQLDDLEEWKAIQQTLPLILLSAQHAKNKLSHSPAHKAYYNAVDDICQEIQMVNLSSPQGSYLPETIVQGCKSKLTELLQLFESFVDEKLVEAALLLTSRCWPSVMGEPIPNSFSENIRIDFPKLARLSGCKAECIPRECLFRFDPSITTIAIIRNAVETITEVNRFLISIVPVSLRSFTPPSIRKATTDVDDSIRRFTDTLLDKLHSLFSKCKYGVSHQMMVQFPELRELDKNIYLATLKLLLSSCVDHVNDTTLWQEASCSYPSNANSNDRDDVVDVVTDLCFRVQESLHLNEHLQLHLLNEELYYIENTNILASQDNATLGQSLYDLIKAGYFQRITWNSEDRFTIWEKRKLALNLGLIFMYLYDCKWTKCGWEATNMHFLASLAIHQRENLLQVPPYLGCGSHLADPNEGIEHPFFKGPSDFLSFGKLLLELEFGEEITATQRDKLGTPSLYLTLLITLEQGRISANKYYTEAIRGCLQLYKNPGQLESVRMRIYGKIVLNLEKEMACLEKPSLPRALTPQVHAKVDDVELYDIESPPPCSPSHSMDSISHDEEHSKPSISNSKTSLRSKSEELSLSVTDQSSDTKVQQLSPGIDLQTSHLPQKHNLRRSARLGKMRTKKEGDRDLDSILVLPGTSKNRISKVRKMKSSARKANLLDVLDDMSKAGSSHISGIRNQDLVSLFDGSVDCQDPSQRKSSDEFFASYKAFKMSILQQHISSGDTSPQEEARISVCVIDTGIDKSHPGIKGGIRRGSIQECRSWIGAPGDVHDEYGHGTHIVQLILDASDNVDIYVAKITDSMDIDRSDIGRIAAAINHATMVWDVDIITMSFGFIEMDPKIEDAINEAVRRGKLLFASAANHGNNGIKTYPAKYRNVICISASDGKGKDGRISPAATDGADNFMTLGIAVPLLWKGAKVYRSGTSYATPIAVGFAVNILELVRRRLGQEEFERLKNGDYLMRRIFRMMSERDNRYYFVAPWRLWDSRKLELVDELIKNELHY